MTFEEVNKVNVRTTEWVVQGANQYYPELRLSKRSKWISLEDVEARFINKQRVRTILYKHLKPVGTTHENVKKVFEELGL